MRKVWIGTVLVTGLSALLIGCESGPPTSREVLDSYVAAIGGDALDGVQSRVATGKFEVADMGYKGEFTMSVVPPGLGRLEIRIGAIAAASSGIKDEVAWDINPMAGARILEAGERGHARRQFALDPVLAWQDSFENAVLQEWEPEAPQIKILIKNADGEQVIFFFDSETKLLTRMMTFINGQRLVSKFDDYRDVDGVMIAHKVSNDMGGSISLEFSYDEVNHNVDIPAETFNFPEEIQKLIDE